MPLIYQSPEKWYSLRRGADNITKSGRPFLGSIESQGPLEISESFFGANPTDVDRCGGGQNSSGGFLMASENYLAFSPGFAANRRLDPLLQRVQGNRYISEESARMISRFLRISENRIYGVASSIPSFVSSSRRRHSVKVCLGTACHVRVAVPSRVRSSGNSACSSRDHARQAVRSPAGRVPRVLRTRSRGSVDADVHSRMTAIRLKQVLEDYE